MRVEVVVAKGTNVNRNMFSIFCPSFLGELVCNVSCFLAFVTGYQRELTYKRADGAYSAFGNRDSEGNMWYVRYL